MIKIDERAISDLEFDEIRLLIHGFANQPTAQLRTVGLEPLRDFRQLNIELNKLNEWCLIRRTAVNFPAIDFEEMEEEIRMLNVRDSVLPEESFERIYKANVLVNEIIRAFEGMENVVPHLFEMKGELVVSEDMLRATHRVFDQKWKVKDDASPELQVIRSEIANVRKTIAKNFSKVLKEYQGKGFLGDTGEAYINDRRVLAIYSTHKRKVPGMYAGQSKTGALTYIEPEINVQYNFELESLFDDERKEIRKILQQLTNAIRHRLSDIKSFQYLLTELDFIQAKGRLCLELDAILPTLSKEPVVSLKRAYHPLLWLSNRKQGKTTLPQTLLMDKFSRMLVISGPNAGGKSITLKTVGLLQIMLQSGLLVPVQEGSTMTFFHHILTDIGDNQSIENQLSTYSYRLKRMKYFLDVANRLSLVLLDEFGTGSDPDLGGALAEVFFEEIYSRKSFGVITTHYGNIKLKAAMLKNAVNGCMLFNTETLEPTYKLSVGQPGSSFTFEVAEINGIPLSMIELAKTKLSESKVHMDKLLSSLQEDKTRFEKMIENANKAAEEASSTITDFEKRKEKYEEKLRKQSDTIERNNKFLNHGRRMSQFIDGYNLRSKNKELLDELKKYIVVEKTKIDEERKQRSLEKKIKAKKGQPVQEEKPHFRERIKVGSTVRLENSKQTGKVLEMINGEVTVAFGIFKTKVDVAKLILVME